MNILLLMKYVILVANTTKLYYLNYVLKNFQLRMMKNSRNNFILEPIFIGRTSTIHFFFCFIYPGKNRFSDPENTVLELFRFRKLPLFHNTLNYDRSFPPSANIQIPWVIKVNTYNEHFPRSSSGTYDQDISSMKNS